MHLARVAFIPKAHSSQRDDLVCSPHALRSQDEIRTEVILGRTSALIPVADPSNADISIPV